MHHCFLTVFGDIQKPYKPKGVYEQPNLIHLINKYEDIKNSVKIIPQFEMNSYANFMPELKLPNILKKIDNTVNRCNWKNGDFLIHLAGFNYLENDKFKFRIEPFIKKYVNRYYENIIKKVGKDYNKIK